MNASLPLLTRRDQLVARATQTILPLTTWWEHYGIELPFDIPTSYFHGRIYSIVQESEAEIDTLARQHPRYITDKKLDDFQQRFDALPESWVWLLREARLFERVRPKVNLTNDDPLSLLTEIQHVVHDIIGISRDVHEAKPYGGRLPELAPLVKELSYLADLAKKTQKSAAEVVKEYRLTYRRESARPPMLTDHRFKIEHDRLYLKFLEAHTLQLKTKFFAVHTPLATLTTRISQALLEWRGILGLLEESPLSAYAWHCCRDLEALAESRDLSLTQLQSAYEMTHLAVQEAFEAQFQRRLF